MEITSAKTRLSKPSKTKLPTGGKNLGSGSEQAHLPKQKVGDISPVLWEDVIHSARHSASRPWREYSVTVKTGIGHWAFF